jgi:putative ABC transport system permease protein
MAIGRRDRWLLIRLAAQNVGRRRLRAIFLGLSVMLGVGVAFASFVAGWALRAGMATSLSRMGADLVVVPRATLVNITSSLLTVQPTDAVLEASMAKSLAKISGVDKVAPQRVVPARVNESDANLIAFDPAADLSVLPWLGEHQPGPLATNGVIAGSRIAARVGEVLRICGMPLVVYGRLEQTGVGPFDLSYFLTFDALGALNRFTHAPGARNGAKLRSASNSTDSLALSSPIEGTDRANICETGLSLDRFSALLLQLSPGAKVEDVKFTIAQFPNVRIVEGNAAVTSSRQALTSLFAGTVVFTALQLIALMIVVSLVFSAIVQERYREIGLLRAMGARPNQIMSIILAEASIITGLSGVAGLALGIAMLLIFARSLGFYFDLLGVPFCWPPLAVLETSAIVAVAFSAVLGLTGAFLPAWRMRQMDPFALIQAQEQ